jgi:hypothetical protein
VRRLRIGTLMLLVAVAALSAALVVQRDRGSRGMAGLRSKIAELDVRDDHSATEIAGLKRTIELRANPMLIFDYGAVQKNADRGRWDVSIAAPNREVADQHFVTHVKLRGWEELKPGDCFIRSRMFERNGIIYSDLEQKVDDGTPNEGGG